MEPAKPTCRAVALLNTIPQPPFNVINPKTKRVIAKVRNESISIMDKGEKESIGAFGINIPPFLRAQFANKNGVDQNDPLFYQAFITAECWNLLRGGYRFEKRE